MTTSGDQNVSAILRNVWQLRGRCPKCAKPRAASIADRRDLRALADRLDADSAIQQREPVDLSNMRRKDTRAEGVVLVSPIEPPAIVLAQAGDDVPRFDVERGCRTMARGGHRERQDNAPDAIRREDFAYSVCLRDQQEEYDYVKLVWSSVTPNVKARCLGLIRGSPAPYQILRSCVNNLMPLEEVKRQGAFRY